MRRIRIRNAQRWMDKPYICLSISCGKSYHEGFDLEASLEQTWRANKKVIIDLSDTLQRHNYIAKGVDAALATELARRDGDEWLRRNRDVLRHAQVIRWDYWLNHKDFPALLNQLDVLDKDDALFSSTVTSDVELFVNRKTNTSDLLRKCSRNFILEEAACEILLGRAYSCSRLYPGKELETLRLLRNLLVPNAPRGLEQTSYYRFTLETIHTQSVADNVALGCFQASCGF